MAVHKRTYRSGAVSWYYSFDRPGSSRTDRDRVTESGFATRKEAVEAEAKRRHEVQQEHEAAIAAAKAAAVPPPRTLANLLDEFFREHAERRLAPKTVERYRDCAVYLSAEFRDMPLADVTPLHCTREWNRLLDSGGHTRGRKDRPSAPRPMSAKTVRNIAGVVSSACAWGIRQGALERNPVENSDLPRIQRSEGMALTPNQQELVIDAASGPWCMGAFLEMCAATGARRGEVLALRWNDLVNDRVFITRSLCQTKTGLVYKLPKNGRTRAITLPAETIAMLESHRRLQETWREQFGPDYRADLDLIFAHPDGEPFRPDSISSAVSALCRRLKLPKGASLHTLRHTHGSHLLAAGMPLPAVSKRLGHSNPYVTAAVYSHAIDGQDQEAARKWEDYQKQQCGRVVQMPDRKRA